MRPMHSSLLILCCTLSLICTWAACTTPRAQAAEQSIRLYLPLAIRSGVPTTDQQPPSQPPLDEQEVIDLTNAYRAQHGCPPVVVVSELMTAARQHSQDMAQNNYFSHTGRDGSEPWDRMLRAGYRWRSAGENIAAGQRSSAEVMDDWEHSDGHRKNIVNCGFRDIGVGRAASADGTVYWTQVFGSR